MLKFFSAIFPLFITLLLFPIDVLSQVKKDNEAIRKMIESYKEDSRGPYRDIRWFCTDGKTVAPKERCPEPGGVQRARYKDEVIALGVNNHIFLGQILATTKKSDFWDEKNNHSMLKQYQLQKFLSSNNNGWINQKAQYYRGAFQIEDEKKWGLEFLEWVLNDAKRIEKHFFLIRQSARDLPHDSDDNLAQDIRALSKDIADAYGPFMNMRVKIHGNPDAGDIIKVKEFNVEHRSKLSAILQQKFESLLQKMELYYGSTEFSQIQNIARTLPSNGKVYESLRNFSEQFEKVGSSGDKCELIVSTAMTVREELSFPAKMNVRLLMLDISNKLESMLMREFPRWNPADLFETLSNVRCHAKACAAFGYIELWEWNEISPYLSIPKKESINLEQLISFLENSQRIVEWGSGMFRANYSDIVEVYSGFEHESAGFIDDKIRSSILLTYGIQLSKLSSFTANQAGFSNQVMDIPNQGSFRGLNPGYAMGELVVTKESPDKIEISGDKIYVFSRPPSDLKPVSGIASVSEGNPVSHVQLLARNLGIPNAVLSGENLDALLPYSGEKMFYAVSNSGTVIMKRASDMTDVERALYNKKERAEERIRVPVENMELQENHVLNLRKVNASKSGKLYGPKAANLGQLKELFPDNVVEGLVIPFGVFKKHFDQAMPGLGISYWDYLNSTFEQAAEMEKQLNSTSEIEQFVLSRLEFLRSAILEISLKSEFKKELQQMFKEVFGIEMGKVPVFVRSDTNMEDLKDFTGAGLNLTLFNVLDSEKIFQGIKDVWASPYTERSYKWRQRFLLNPENVFPSILIIPSVNVTSSGVLITKGVGSGINEEITIAFNKGVGGAVEGQASETWLISSKGNLLLSPAREPKFIAIPASGGTRRDITQFANPVLSESNLIQLKNLAEEVKVKLSEAGIHGPYDIELGLKDDKIWLFQVRPFVENKKALASEYLKSITPVVNTSKSVSLKTKI